MKFRCNEIVDISWQSDREWENYIIPAGARHAIGLFLLCVSLAGRKNYTQCQSKK